MVVEPSGQVGADATTGRIHHDQVRHGLGEECGGIPDMPVVGVRRATGQPTAHPTGQPGSQLRSALSRSEEHTSELQSLMRISYAVFCLKKKNNTTATNTKTTH